MSDDRDFNILFNLAQMLDNNNGARIITSLNKRGNSIAYGSNKKKTHPFQKRFGKMEDCIQLHAEVDVIKNALREYSVTDLKKFDLYIMRAKRLGRGKPFIPGLAKPCSGCMRAIVAFDINNVYYSTENSYEWSCL